MPTSVRLDPDTEALLDTTAKAFKTTKSEILKASIKEYCEKALAKKRRKPYELISDLIGTERSGLGNLAIDSEKILREAFRKKR
ncbi:MAG TPA: ribbon-helix-helix protein, CopG family [Deltaproteobacteria bacterium]|nr:ribbon-helix-helix protein, CopG family [Deltaproteobacteria bacterium]